MNTLTIASAVIAVVSLGVAIVFYRWAEASAKESQRSLGQLSYTLATLDGVVRRLESESFSLIRTAYTDMHDLARVAVERGPNHSLKITSPNYDIHGVTQIRDEEAGSRSTMMKPGKREVSREDIQDLSLSLGRHMMERRGTDFPKVLADLQARVNTMFDELAPGKVLTTGEIAAALKPDGFDIGEVAYALAVMRETGLPGGIEDA